MAKMAVPSENIYDKGPKYWHGYIRAHVLHTVQRVFVNNKHSLIRAGLVKAQKTITSHGLKFLDFVNKNQHLIFHVPRESSVISLHNGRPTLWILLDKYLLVLPKSLKHYSSSRKWWSPNIIWFAKLDRQLSSKLFVRELVIPTTQMDHCTMGHLRFAQCGSQQTTTVLLCGARSSIEAFLPHRMICIQLRLLQTSRFSLHVLFSVSDDVIVTIPPPTFSSRSVSTSLSSLGLHVFSKERFIYLYVLHAALLNRIRLVRPRNVSYNMQVFDGPGVLSANVDLAGNSYTASTFQCAVLFEQFKVNENHVLKFVPIFTKPHVFANILAKSKRNIIFPSNFCKNVCKIFLKTHPWERLNVSVHSMKFQGNDFSACEQGGLAFVQLRQGKPEGLGSLCQNVSADQLQKRSLYSTQPYAYILLYSYTRYSEMKAELTVSTTPCERVSFTPCLLHKYCKDMSTACSLGISGFQNVKFTTVEGALSEGRFAAMPMVYRPVSLHPRACVVMIFAGADGDVYQKYKNNPAPCMIELLPDTLHPDPVKVFHHSIRAFLDSSASTNQDLSIIFRNKKLKNVPFSTRIVYSKMGRNGTLQMASGKFRNHTFSFRKIFYADNMNHDMFVNAYVERASHVRNMLQIVHRVHPDVSMPWLEITFWMSKFTGILNDKILPGGIILKIHPERYLDVRSWSDSLGTVKFQYLKNYKEKLSQNRFLYTHVCLGLHQSIKWSMKTSVEALVEGYELSIPQNRVLMMCCKNQMKAVHPCDPCNGNYMQMINNRYQDYDYVMTNEPRNCTSLLGEMTTKCLFFTHLHHHNFTLMWFARPRSWFDVHSVCNGQGASLPTFFDRREFNEFLALLKFLQDTYLTSIFIGLIQKGSNGTTVSFKFNF